MENKYKGLIDEIESYLYNARILIFSKIQLYVTENGKLKLPGDGLRLDNDKYVRSIWLNKMHELEAYLRNGRTKTEMKVQLEDLSTESLKKIFDMMYVGGSWVKGQFILGYFHNEHPGK